jgi:hypothetical protein
VWNNDVMPAEQVEHYIRRAVDFFQCMQLVRDDEQFRDSSALLAVHSAVSFSDALRVGLGDAKLSSEDHGTAADALKRALLTRRWQDESGLKHLHDLTSKKSQIAYGGKRFSDYRSLIDKAEKFAAWSNKVGGQLRIEGWRNVNE